MIGAITYEDVCRSIASSYGKYAWEDRDYVFNVSQEAYKKVKLIGILFAPPHAMLAKAEIIPGLDYFNRRSGNNIDFFCAGYAVGWEHADYVSIGKKVDNHEWVYSNETFDKFRKEIVSRSRWKYSGESDLILINSFYDSAKRSVDLDFSKAIVCRLDEMKKTEAVTSVASFFEDIFNYAEQADPYDPCWGFGNTQGLKGGGAALIRLLLSLLPKDLGKDFSRLAHFATQDISVIAP